MVRAGAGLAALALGGIPPAKALGGRPTATEEVAMSCDGVITGLYPEAQEEVATRLQEIMDAARLQDVDRLESYHLYGPKFTKFDDFEPLERQDAEATKRLEREAITGVKEFVPRVDDLKVDVFGPVAIATFGLIYDVTTNDDERLAMRARSTLVFAKEDAEWKIVHEHFSPFKSNP
jgi:ketosteroid isomerase-like protein